jgi:hypothetical protein
MDICSHYARVKKKMIVNKFLALGILIPMLILLAVPLAAAVTGGTGGDTGDAGGTGGSPGTTPPDTTGSPGTTPPDTTGSPGTTPPDTTGVTKHHHHGSGSSSDSKHGGLIQIPSNKTDFPDNDPNVIQVHVTSAKKDIIGAWHITGEITNVGNDSLQFVHITAHLYDATGQLVGNGDGYTSPTNLDSQHTGTFDTLITKDTLSGTPTNYRLSYDWS